MAKINNLIVVELQDWDHDALMCRLTKYFSMIRPTTPDDTAALLALAKWLYSSWKSDAGSVHVLSQALPMVALTLLVP